MKVNLTSYGLPRGGEESEDSFAVKAWGETVIAVLADGTGAARQGREASTRIVESLVNNYTARPESWSPQKALTEFTRLINRVFAAIACLLVLVIMAAIVVQIVYRFVLDDPVAWVLDITIFLLVFVFFLALAPTLQSGGHIEVDMFDALIPGWLRKPVRFIGKLLTVTFAAIFFWYVAAFYQDIVEVDEISFTMLIVQLKYVYWIGPVGAFQFLLTAIVLLVRFWREPLAADDEVATDAH